MTIKAIETRYKGWRFRSRTEARWAIFFEAAGIKFEYEPQGVVVDGKAYLPDFWLPDAKHWIEVKGDSASDEEVALCRALAGETGCPCLIAIGSPRQNGGVYEYLGDRHPDDPFADGSINYHFADDRRDDGAFWLTDGQQAHLIIKSPTQTDHDRYPLVHSATARAYEASNSARFEHGESGSG